MQNWCQSPGVYFQFVSGLSMSHWLSHVKQRDVSGVSAKTGRRINLPTFIRRLRTVEVVRMVFAVLRLSISLLLPAVFLYGQDRVRHVGNRSTIGIALEGGGAKGLAHIGVLQWLEEHQIPVDYVAGTSMGGLVGGLYATGLRPSEIQKIVSGINWDEVLAGQTPYRALAFRRKEDLRAYPNRLEVGLRGGLSLPGGLTSGQSVRVLLDRYMFPYSEPK